MSVGQSVNAFQATLAQSLAAGGSETTIYLSTITTLTGETVSSSDFSVFGKGTVTIDPLSSTNVEFASFTGVDSTNIAFTGAVRGLSSFDYTASTSRAKYHPVGTRVIIAFGVHNLLDLITYVQNTLTGFTGTASDTAAGSVKLTYNLGANARARASLVSQHSTGDMSLSISNWSYQNGSTSINFIGKQIAFINGSAGSTFTAPSGNPRYDLIVYRPSLTDVTSITGTEAASPSLPTPTNGDIVLAAIYHRVGEIKIKDTDDSTNGYIAYWYEPTAYANATNLSGAQVVAGIDQSQATQNSTYAVGETNATTKHSTIAQKFTPTLPAILGVKLYKAADTGSFTGTVKVALQADSSGNPSGSDLAFVTINNANWLEYNTGELAVAFTSQYESMTVSSPYWIVISPSTSDTSNHPNLGINTAGGYSGALKYNNSADGWVLTATSMLYFKTIEGSNSKVVKTLSDGNLPAPTRSKAFLVADATQTSIASNSASVAETTLYKKSVEGGFWNANSGFKLRLCATGASAGSSGTTTCTVRIKYAGQTLLSYNISGTSGNASSATTTMIDVYVINNNSMSSQLVYYTGLFNVANSTTTPPSTINTPYPIVTSTTSIDTTLAGSIEITGQIVAAAGANGMNITYQSSLIERITSYTN